MSLFSHTSAERPSNAPEPPPAAAAAEEAEHAQLVEQLTSGAIRDQAKLAKLAIEGASTRIRQMAAEAIDAPDVLREMLKDVRGKDKNVYKIIRHKCDALLAQEKDAAERQAHIESVLAALERHRHAPFDSLFAPTLAHLRGQWSALIEHAADELRARAQSALQRCDEVVATHEHAVAEQTARTAAAAQADANRQTLLTQLQAMLAAVYDEAATAVDAQLTDVTQQWNQLETHKASSKEDKERYARLRNAIEAVRDAIVAHGSLEQQAAVFRDASADADLRERARALHRTLAQAKHLDERAPVSIAAASAALQKWEQTRADSQATHERAIKQASNLARAAASALRNGQSRQAAGMRRSLDHKLQALTAVPEHLTKQVQQLDERLKELSDWRSYAVAPKRVELIEQMESLVAASIGPTKRAERIKKLQEEWKSISKGNTDNADEEWRRFQDAAHKAYEPCREHFATQAKLRADNLEKRKALLARLTQFAAEQNWEQPDWREVSKAVFESAQIWRRYQPVERAANKPLQADFDAALADLQNRLSGEQQKHAAEKHRLIARARGLLTVTDARKAMDEIKRLQASWKEVGAAARDEEQKLWQEFRQHCDAVFARRDQERSAQRAEFDASKARVVALCEEAEQLAAQSGAELAEAAKKLPALRDAFDAVGELPKALERELSARFARAVDRLKKNMERQRTLEQAEAWDSVLQASDKIRIYRLALLERRAAEECEALKVGMQTFVDSVARWPKGALAAVRRELDRPGEVDVAANEKALRILCIRAEILRDAPTPPSDQSLRRSHQMQRLAQGFGRSGANADDIDALTLEWIAVGATHNDIYAELLTRFIRCRRREGE